MSPDMSGVVDVVGLLQDALIAVEEDNKPKTIGLLRAAVQHVEGLQNALADYADHQSWRCNYRSRYGKCMCGLDELLASYGLPAVPPNDPEAERKEKDE